MMGIWVDGLMGMVFWLEVLEVLRGEERRGGRGCCVTKMGYERWMDGWMEGLGRRMGGERLDICDCELVVGDTMNASSIFLLRKGREVSSVLEVEVEVKIGDCGGSCDTSGRNACVMLTRFMGMWNHTSLSHSLSFFFRFYHLLCMKMLLMMFELQVAR